LVAASNDLGAQTAQKPAGGGVEIQRRADPRIASTLNADLKLKSELHQTLTRGLASGLSYAEIAAQLPFGTTTRNVAMGVDRVLRNLGVAPPAGAPDLVVALHNLGLQPADPRVLERAELAMRLREDTGARVDFGPKGTKSLDVLTAWNDGASRATLAGVMGRDSGQKLTHFVNIWLKRFELPNLGSYPANVNQIVALARERGYVDAPGAGSGAPSVPTGASDVNLLNAAQRRGRALDLDSLNPISREASVFGSPLQVGLARLLAAGLGYEQIAQELELKTPAKSLAVTVTQMLRKLGIQAPSSAADLIVALDGLGLQPADPKTLELATLMLRMREDLGTPQRWPGSQSPFLNMLGAWNEGADPYELMDGIAQRPGASEKNVHQILQNYVAQIVEAARARGYIEAPNGDA
jgi:DNA-binding NarL/FixJ family response regulator